MTKQQQDAAMVQLVLHLRAAARLAEQLSSDASGDLSKDVNAIFGVCDMYADAIQAVMSHAAAKLLDDAE